MLKQRTLKQVVRTVGIGLHSGTKVELLLRPAAADTGVVFRRIDLDPPVDIPLSPERVVDTRMATTIGSEGQVVATIEHLMSAISGLGIDNCYVDVDAPEIPIMDGSAASFVFLIQSAGIVETNAPKKFVRVLKPVEIVDGDKWARLEPYSGFRLKFSIEFKHPAIDATEQVVEVDFARESFVKDVARARTFGFVNEVEALRAAGLAIPGKTVVFLARRRVLEDDDVGASGREDLVAARIGRVEHAAFRDDHVERFQATGVERDVGVAHAAKDIEYRRHADRLGHPWRV